MTDTAATQWILVVDDDIAIRESIRQILESSYPLLLAHNGQEALDLLWARVQHHLPLPNLILLDVMMPQRDGWQFRAEQLRHPVLQSIPVVAMTAEPRLLAIAKALNVTTDACLIKPFRAAELLRVVQTFMPAPPPSNIPLVPEAAPATDQIPG